MIYRSDIFSRIVESVPMVAVAERYGFSVNRAGDMVCPFQEHSHPALHVYPEDRGWYCFHCGEGGSVIDFVAKLFHLTPRQAAIRLDNDFHLGLTTQRPDRRAVNEWVEKRRREQDKLAAYQAEYDAKCREAYAIRSAPKPPPGSPLWGEYAALLGRLDYLENCWFEQHKWAERYSDLQEMR
jgi:DNA primase